MKQQTQRPFCYWDPLVGAGSQEEGSLAADCSRGPAQSWHVTHTAGTIVLTGSDDKGFTNGLLPNQTETVAEVILFLLSWTRQSESTVFFPFPKCHLGGSTREKPI